MRAIVITDSAQADLELITDFMQTQFSVKIKIDFLLRLTERFLLIENMPFMYPVSIKNPLIRRCLIHKNVSCFYEVTDTQILILSIQDNRINPDNSKF